MHEPLQVIAQRAPVNARGWVRCHGAEQELKALDPWMRAYPPHIWFHEENGISVVSGVEVVEPGPGEQDLGPEYHLSIVSVIQGRSQRCSTVDAMWVLAQFDLMDAKEDNHGPLKLARSFWRPVADHLSGFECPCQETEPAVVLDKGDYVWRPQPKK